MKTIEVVVTPDGQVCAQTRGFAGRACLAASRWLEGALGCTVNDQLTSEFYQHAVADEHPRVVARPKPA